MLGELERIFGDVFETKRGPNGEFMVRLRVKPKRKNQTDLTLRNLRALKKTVKSLEARVATLEQQVLGLTNPAPVPPQPTTPPEPVPPPVDDN